MKNHIEYLKASEFPIVLYGTAQLGKYVKCFLDWHNIKIDFVAVDKEYWKPDMNFYDFEVQSLEHVLKNTSKANIIMAFIGKNNKEKVEELNKMPNVQKCMFLNLEDIFSYLKHCELTQTEKIDRVKNLIKCSDIYLKDEETAKSLADSWNGEINKPQNLRFIENAIPVVLCANESYAPYLAVMLQSLLDHSNPNRVYHFIIFERGFSTNSKKCLSEQVAKFLNCEIDFVSVSFDGCYINSVFHFSIDAFSRLFISYWLDKYPKVIYCDSDMIAKTDIAKLYDLDIRPFCMAAVIDQLAAFDFHLKNKDYSKFLHTSALMFLENWFCYFNTGILVLDTQKFKKLISYQDLFRFIIYYTNRYSKHLVDQDVLNILIKDNFFVLPPEWNYHWRSSKNKLHYLVSKSDTKILHFVTEKKPWKDVSDIENHPDVLAYREYAKKVKLFRERTEKFQKRNISNGNEMEKNELN